jgi:hypothetical protein
MVEECSGILRSQENYLRDRKLGKDKGILEGIVCSMEPTMDHKESVVGSQAHWKDPSLHQGFHSDHVGD